ncbi:rab-GTPase-TBC domain-containing protein [Phycomyces blakesleeanus]|uniref:Rab-GTPase-TBC domain-containing protein n=1 Tax=Phycomyces blakesleeanus TaxID=4837 RepID=A0ABR3AMA8_PHYBL
MPKRHRASQMRNRKFLDPKKLAFENQKFKRIFKINEGLRSHNLELLRECGRKEGFVNDAMRRRVWPVLLRCEETIGEPLEILTNTHKDESQVALDVPRSVNRYPPNIDDERRKALQDDLKLVILHVLRSCPSLHYYQGFHDVCTVFLLLFGVNKAIVLVEKLAIYFLRDAMLVELGPVLEELSLVDSLIMSEDEELAAFIKKSDIVPFYALSWVITWCSHDLDDLDKITRLFDFFLCSNPLMPVYFTAAVVLSRRSEILRLECEFSTVHGFLTKLPQDIDVERLIGSAIEIEGRYPPIALQYKSGIGLATISTVNTYDDLWISLDTATIIKEGEVKVDPAVLAAESEAQAKAALEIPHNERTRLPIPTKTTQIQGKDDEFKHHSEFVLDKLRRLSRQDVFMMAAISAGVGTLAFLISQDILREWILF